MSVDPRSRAQRRDTEVLEIEDLPRERGDGFVGHTGFDPRSLATPYRWFVLGLGRPRRLAGAQRLHGPKRRGCCRDRADEGEPDLLLEAGQIEPGDADGDREGGPASQMETR